MPSKGVRVKLGDLIRVKHGFAFKGEHFVDEATSHVLVTPGNFAIGGGFQDTKLKFYRGPVPEEYILKPGDLVATMTDLSRAADTLGYGAVVPKHRQRVYLHNQRIGLVELLQPKDISKAWLHYLMRTSEYREWVVGSATGSTVRHTSPSRICEFEFELPAIKVQEEAATVLDALESRIELLRQTNATLESIAQALFKSWFIDFDPVRAKAEGREPEGMDAATAALFPSEFDQSALGLIPKGWMVSSISDMCVRVSNGGTPSRSKPDFWMGGTVPWFKTGELFDGHLLRSTEHITLEAVASTSVKVLPRHTVLMAIYAAPTVGRLGILTTEAAFNQACTGMVARPEIGPWFLFQSLFHGRDWFNSRANGAAQQNISKAIVESYQCVRPPSVLLRTFDELARALYASAERNSRQAEALAQLRDTLLPRLISGKLRLPDAEADIEAVA